jgi:O-antigen/teichoic acid export membrane protein
VLKQYATRISAASISPVASFTLRFLRTIILSRFLTPEHVGASVALFTILSLCEGITTVGLDTFVLVHAGGQERARALAAAQQIAFFRGLILGAAIFLFAPLLASLFGASVQSVAWLGAVSAVASVKNLGVVQVQQEFRYLPEALSVVGGQIAAVVAAFLAAAHFRDERAMLASLVAEAFACVLLSYVLVPRLAPRAHAADVDPIMRRAALTFGAPLMLNGAALMILGALDRSVVVNLFDLTTLALYSLAVNLVLAPASILTIVLQNIGMPILIRPREDQGASKRASLMVLMAVLFVASPLAVSIALFLDRLLPIIYGAQYHVTQVFSALMAGIVLMRICRNGVNIILLAQKATARATTGNTISNLGVLIGFLLTVRYRELETFVAGLLIGEVLSLAALYALVSRYVFPVAVFPLHVLGVALALGLIAFARSDAQGVNPGSEIALLSAAVLAVGLEAIMIFRNYVYRFAGSKNNV